MILNDLLKAAAQIGELEPAWNHLRKDLLKTYPDFPEFGTKEWAVFLEKALGKEIAEVARQLSQKDGAADLLSEDVSEWVQQADLDVDLELNYFSGGYIYRMLLRNDLGQALKEKWDLNAPFIILEELWDAELRIKFKGKAKRAAKYQLLRLKRR